MRILTDTQGAALRRTLQGHRESLILIAYIPNNLKSHMLAQDFYDVLLEAGWPVEEPSPMDLLSSDEVQIGVSDCDNPPQCARLLHNALKSLGVRTPARLVRGQQAGQDRCCLMVGNCEKPVNTGD
jgi:hypothetical protein